METEWILDMTDVTSIHLLFCHMQSTLLFIPLPRQSMLTQSILQHHQICNLLAEQVKMNELFNGREDHLLIPSMP